MHWIFYVLGGCIIGGIIVGLIVAALKEEEEKDGGYGKIVHYDDMVYYIPFTGDKFAKNLVTFLKTNTHLEVAGMTGDNLGSYGTNEGYFVVFRNKLPQ